jgi:hypothetical protein
MFPSLTSVLREIRDDLADRLETLALRDLCHSLGCRRRVSCGRIGHVVFAKVGSGELPDRLPLKKMVVTGRLNR